MPSTKNSDNLSIYLDNYELLNTKHLKSIQHFFATLNIEDFHWKSEQIAEQATLLTNKILSVQRSFSPLKSESISSIGAAKSIDLPQYLQPLLRAYTDQLYAINRNINNKSFPDHPDQDVPLTINDLLRLHHVLELRCKEEITAQYIKYSKANTSFRLFISMIITVYLLSTSAIRSGFILGLTIIHIIKTYLPKIKKNILHSINTKNLASVVKLILMVAAILVFSSFFIGHNTTTILSFWLLSIPLHVSSLCMTYISNLLFISINNIKTITTINLLDFIFSALIGAVIEYVFLKKPNRIIQNNFLALPQSLLSFITVLQKKTIHNKMFNIVTKPIIVILNHIKWYFAKAKLTQTKAYLQSERFDINFIAIPNEQYVIFQHFNHSIERILNFKQNSDNPAITAKNIMDFIFNSNLPAIPVNIEGTIIKYLDFNNTKRYYIDHPELTKEQAQHLLSNTLLANLSYYRTALTKFLAKEHHITNKLHVVKIIPATIQDPNADYEQLKAVLTKLHNLKQESISNRKFFVSSLVLAIILILMFITPSIAPYIALYSYGVIVAHCLINTSIFIMTAMRVLSADYKKIVSTSNLGIMTTGIILYMILFFTGNTITTIYKAIPEIISSYLINVNDLLPQLNINNHNTLKFLTINLTTLSYISALTLEFIMRINRLIQNKLFNIFPNTQTVITDLITKTAENTGKLLEIPNSSNLFTYAYKHAQLQALNSHKIMKNNYQHKPGRCKSHIQ